MQLWQTPLHSYGHNYIHIHMYMYILWCWQQIMLSLLVFLLATTNLIADDRLSVLSSIHLFIHPYVRPSGRVCLLVMYAGSQTASHPGFHSTRQSVMSSQEGRQYPFYKLLWKLPLKIIYSPSRFSTYNRLENVHNTIDQNQTERKYLGKNQMNFSVWYFRLRGC